VVAMARIAAAGVLKAEELLGGRREGEMYE
jgi:hypothetical protein